MRVNKRKTVIIALLFVALLLIVSPIQLVKAQTATVSVSPQNSSVIVGQAFSVNIEISNVQNLYAVDITLNWNTSMLNLVSNQSYVGVSNGVLNAPISEVQDTASQASGQYHLVATSEAPAGPFSGSGTVATLTFTVTSKGQSTLTLNPQLASYPQGQGGTSEFINANVVNGVVTTSSSTSPSTSQTPSSSPSRSPSSSPSTSSSPTATSPPLLKSPVFPILLAAIVVVVVVLVTLAVALSRRKSKKLPASS